MKKSNCCNDFILQVHAAKPQIVRGCAPFSFFFLFFMADILPFEMSSCRIHHSQCRVHSCRALPSTGFVLFGCENTSLFIASAVEERNPGNISLFPILTFFLGSEIAVQNLGSWCPATHRAVCRLPATPESPSCRFSVSHAPRNQNLHVPVD